jgi:DNA repair photolyase
MEGTGFVPAVLTRAARIREDVGLLARFPRAVVGISIPTDDDAIRRAFEPGGDPIPDRVEALAAFHRAGVTTMAFIQPILPMNARRLVDLIAPLTKIVRIDRMHDVDRVRHLYRAAGREDAAEDRFFEETAAELRELLVARGVSVDPLEDLAFVAD